MRRPLAVFVGLRYLRASKGSGFVSFVNAASVAGVALGVATLIVVLSVMNGFENELRDRLLGLTSHATLSSANAGVDWPEVSQGLRGAPGIRGAAPFIELEAMLAGDGGMTPAVLDGIEPELEASVSRLSSSMLLGNLADLRPGSKNIVLGRGLAARLGVAVGTSVNVLVPRANGAGRGISSTLTRFTVSGLFELGVQDHDSVRAILHIEDARMLVGARSATTGVRVETDDIFSAPQVVRAAVERLGMAGRLEVRDWTEQNASYFRAIRIEKLMMGVLLSLIIGIAAFNIVAMLVMVVSEKRGGIAILRTLGCSRRDVIAIFVLQGTLIGWAGSIVGITLGIWLALNVGTVAPALEAALGFQFMPADVYYLTALPSDLRPGDVLVTAAVVLAVTALATVYPATRAARVQPAEVLRYE